MCLQITPEFYGWLQIFWKLKIIEFVVFVFLIDTLRRYQALRVCFCGRCLLVVLYLKSTYWLLNCWEIHSAWKSSSLDNMDKQMKERAPPTETQKLICIQFSISNKHFRSLTVSYFCVCEWTSWGNSPFEAYCLIQSQRAVISQERNPSALHQSV